MGFGTDNKLGTFTGSPLVARFETAEFSPNEGGFFHLRAVRPLVTGSPSLVTVAVAKRVSTDNAALTYASGVTRNSRSGVCDFRDEVRFGALRKDITGGFDKALGLQIEGEVSGWL